LEKELSHFTIGWMYYPRKNKHLSLIMQTIDQGTFNANNKSDWIQQQFEFLKQKVQETGTELDRCRQDQVDSLANPLKILKDYLRMIESTKYSCLGSFFG
jgi:hypothetical protein